MPAIISGQMQRCTKKKPDTAARPKLTEAQKDDFFERHLRHRLTLLRAFQYRCKQEENSVPEGERWRGRGDIYRCLKDSALISMRLLLEAMGLQGSCDNGTYKLEQAKQSRFDDDVRIDQLGGEESLAILSSIDTTDRCLLAGIYCRAHKELAHLTLTYDDKFNTQEVMLEGAGLVEGLIRKHLYEKVGKEFPPITFDG
jgi:hypothetical protein